MRMIGNCCCDCESFMFRGASGGSLSSFEITMEPLHGWAVRDAIPTYAPPAWSQESFSSPVSMDMTYEYPIPDAFANGLIGSGKTFSSTEIASGWYVGPSMTLLAFTGDPAFSGTKEPITGRWFYGPDGRIGFWLDTDYPYSGFFPSVYQPQFGLWYLNRTGALMPESGPVQSMSAAAGPMVSAVYRTTTSLRAVDLFDLGLDCVGAFFASQRKFWIRQLTDESTAILGQPHPSPYWGVYADFFRRYQDIDDATYGTNPLDLDLGSLSDPGNPPLYAIPPVEMEIYRGEQMVLEYFCVQFTATR
jgi:hypothetical protein